jgi:hypothetical protein
VSSPKNNPRRRSLGPVIPKGVVLGDFSNYKEATALVEKLIEGDFPAAMIAIIGRDPVLVERVRSRLGYGRIAASGAITGFWMGIIFALLLGSGISIDDAGAVSYVPTEFMSVILMAAGIGMLFNILRFALAKSKRGFLSSQMPIASRYEVLVPESDAAAAHKALALASTPK